MHLQETTSRVWRTEKFCAYRNLRVEQCEFLELFGTLNGVMSDGILGGNCRRDICLKL